ncbi:MAG: DUF222 domain-containing protein, partial [Thermocrispum sp.]
MSDLAAMDKHQLAAELQRSETRMRQAQARQAGVLAEMAARGTMAEYGYGSLETLQVDLLAISRREATRRGRRATALHPTVGVSGAVIEAVAPRTATAFAAGALSVEHVDEVPAALEQVPTTATTTAA